MFPRVPHRPLRAALGTHRLRRRGTSVFSETAPREPHRSRGGEPGGDARLDASASIDPFRCTLVRGTSRSLLPRRFSRLGADPHSRTARSRFGSWSLSRSSPISDVLRRSRGTTNIGSDAAGSLLRHVHPTRADTHGGEPREPSPHVRWRFRPFARMNKTSTSCRSGALSRPRISASACDRSAP